MSPAEAEPDVLVVVPCFNEEKRLHPHEFRSALEKQSDLGFVFVNDGSTDNTQRLLEGLRDEYPVRVDLLSLSPNAGKGEAVRRGILRAVERRPTFIGYWDADLSTPLSEVRVFRDLLSQKPERLAVMGARVQLLGKRIHRRPVRHYAGRVFATVASALLGLAVYDTQCGAKLLRNRDDVVKLFDVPFVSRWVFDVEILARLVRQRQLAGANDVANLVYEHPLDEWRDIAGSKVHVGDFFAALVDLWRIGRANGLLFRQAAR